MHLIKIKRKHFYVHSKRFLKTVESRRQRVLIENVILTIATVFLLVPCAPENVTTDLLCDTNDVRVSWTSSLLLLNYSVMAVPLDGSSPTTCKTNNASCVLKGFQCGKTLNISVKASSDSCSGPLSLVQVVQTGNDNTLLKFFIIIIPIRPFKNYKIRYKTEQCRVLFGQKVE